MVQLFKQHMRPSIRQMSLCAYEVEWFFDLEVYLSVRFLTSPCHIILHRRSICLLHCYDVLTLFDASLWCMWSEMMKEHVSIFFKFSSASIRLCVKSLQRCLSSLKLITMQSEHICSTLAPSCTLECAWAVCLHFKKQLWQTKIKG